VLVLATLTEVSMVVRVRWSRPELVVLGKADPQEAVLRGCKQCCVPNAKSGANHQYNECFQDSACGVVCQSVAYS